MSVVRIGLKEKAELGVNVISEETFKECMEGGEESG